MMLVLHFLRLLFCRVRHGINKPMHSERENAKYIQSSCGLCDRIHFYPLRMKRGEGCLCYSHYPYKKSFLVLKRFVRDLGEYRRFFYHDEYERAKRSEKESCKNERKRDHIGSVSILHRKPRKPAHFDIFSKF